MTTSRAKRLRAGRMGRAIHAAAGSFRATAQDRSRVHVSGGGMDRHADTVRRDILRNLSRDLERSAEHYFVLIHGLGRLLGSPHPRPTTGHREFDREVSRRWKARAKAKRGGFDHRGLKTWDDLTTTWWRQWLRDGDLAAIPLQQGTIATVDAERIAGGPGFGNQHRRTIGGVTVDAEDRPLQYWVAPRGRHGALDVRAAEPIDADALQFLALLWTTDQTRGVPLATAGLDDQERIDALVEAEVISSEQASHVYGQFVRDLAAGQHSPPPQSPLGSPDPAALRTGSDDDTIDWLDFAAGSYWDNPAGVKWETIQTGRPNLDVPEFMRALLRGACAYMGIPYAVIYCDFKDINWSGNRGLVSLTRDSLDHHRSLHCEPFVDPFYTWWLAGELARDLDLPEGIDDPYAHVWDWPDRPEWPDPYKEEQRHEKALGQYTTSLQRILGHDWEQVVRERHVEQVLIDELTITRYQQAVKKIDQLRKADPGFDLTAREVLARDYDAQSTLAAAITPTTPVTTDEGQ